VCVDIFIHTHPSKQCCVFSDEYMYVYICINTHTPQESTYICVYMFTRTHTARQFDFMQTYIYDTHTFTCINTCIYTHIPQDNFGPLEVSATCDVAHVRISIRCAPYIYTIYIYIYIYITVCIYHIYIPYIYIYIYIYLHIYCNIYVNTMEYINVYSRVQTCDVAHVRISIRCAPYIYIYVYIYMCIYMYMYIYIFTHILSHVCIYYGIHKHIFASTACMATNAHHIHNIIMFTVLQSISLRISKHKHP